MKGESSKHLKQTLLPEECDDYMKRLKKEVPWQRMKWGTRGYLPRLIYRDEGINTPEPILDLIKYTEASFECSVRSVWCNYYQSGNDYTPPHQDNYAAHVITYSFGGSRRFICENLNDKTKKEYLLSHGDVFYFSPEFDRQHKHSIPKTKKAVDPRISIVLFTDLPFSQSHWGNIGNMGIEKPPAVGHELIGQLADGEVLLGENVIYVRIGNEIVEAYFENQEDITPLIATLIRL